MTIAPSQELANTDDQKWTVFICKKAKGFAFLV